MDSDATTVKRCERAERCVCNAAENLKSGDRLAGISSLRAALAHLEHHIDAADMTERNTLRDQLAYTCARSDIESNCLGLRHGTEAINDQLVVRRLWNTAMATGGGAPDEPHRIARAIRYLDLCGLIKRQSHAPYIIQILDQPPPLPG